MAQLKTLPEFIEEANRVHANKYDYSRFVYTSAISKSIIVCPEHGSFEQSPNQHLRPRGCPDCGRIVQGMKQKQAARTNALEKAALQHGDRYDYSLVPDRCGVSEKVPIVCDLHGQFFMSLNTHKRKGCPKCGRAEAPGWYSRKRLERGDLDRETAILYVIRLASDTESFIKVGITKLNLEHRMYELRKSYSYELLRSLTDTIPNVKSMETRLKRALKAYRYVPQTSFGGHTECFSEVALGMVEETMTAILQDRYEIAR